MLNIAKLLSVVGLLMLVTSCTKEYSLSDFKDFKARPVLNGYISEKYGIQLQLSKTLNPLNRDTVSLEILGAKIYLVSDGRDSTLVSETENGRYANSHVELDYEKTYALVADVPQFESIRLDEIRIPERIDFVSVAIDTSQLDESALRFTVEIEDRNIEDYWYWFRFVDANPPRWTDLDNLQLYDLCEANTYTSSNEIVFSSACSSKGKMSITFTSHYRRQEVPGRVEIEVVRIETTFGHYLREISEISDLDLAFVEPPAPISNTNIGLGYVAPMTVYDTTFVIR